MADTLYIKTAAFCGYDKTDVDKRLEALYSLIYNLKNEIRENKQLIKKYQEGYSQDRAYENALAVERAQLTQLQVKNENLTEKNKARKEELKLKEQENAKLRDEIAALKEEVEELRLKQLALQNNNTEDLGIIFIEAKKSRDLILNNAKSEAATCKSEAEAFVEELIAETNLKVEALIKTAENKANEIITAAESKNKMLIADEVLLKKNILANIKTLYDDVLKMKALINGFNNNTSKIISDSEQLLMSTENKLSGNSQSSVPDKTNISVSITPNKPQSAPKQQVRKNESGINLDDLLKQANELNKV